MITLSRRSMLKLGGALLAGTALPRPAFAFGESDRFDMPLLRYDSPSWNPRPHAIRRTLLEIDLTTSIRVANTPGSLRLEAEELAQSPFAVLAGDREFAPWSDRERRMLRNWLSSGGMLFIDSSEGVSDGGFDRSVRRELAAILPESPLRTIPEDHVLWKTFYIVRQPVGRMNLGQSLQGISHDGRLAVIYSDNDVLGAWSRDNFGSWDYEVFPGGESQRDQTIRFGVNLAMYALCLDYKADQVHVQHLLRQRRWRVGP